MQFRDLILGTLLALLALVEAKSKADSAILLSKVKTLTLHGDRQTSHRRVSPIPQLTCIGGSGCRHYNVDMMRCQNAGSEYDAEDIQWTCSASLPPEFKLGSTEVVCEGYDNADDPWVLKGSCGAEYRLLLTDEGERKYGSKSKPTYRPKQEYAMPKEGSEAWQSVLARYLFWLVFVGIVCLILYRVFNPPNDDGRIRLDGNNRPGWGGGGGGGNDPFDDPPPPYSPRPPSQPRAKPSSSRASTAGSSRNSGPGFWSGAATGGAAGYGAGYYHGSRMAEAERRTREQASQSSWFGSGSGGGSGTGGGSSTPSSSRHESTGFGGTRRR